MTRLADAYRVPPAAELPDYLTGDDRAHAEGNERRWQVIVGLRNLAQMLIDHPELPTPYVVSMQAGPLSGPWDEQRQIVLDAAEALGQPLYTDEPTQATVIARLTEEYATPRVTYTVNAMRSEPAPVEHAITITENAPDACWSPGMLLGFAWSCTCGAKQEADRTEEQWGYPLSERRARELGEQHVREAGEQ